jgi:hypothetical protein
MLLLIADDDCLLEEFIFINVNYVKFCLFTLTRHKQQFVRRIRKFEEKLLLVCVTQMRKYKMLQNEMFFCKL